MIGVFDSGLGGLTILKELLEKLPQYNYIYLGDNARAPYGHKSQTTIYNYTREAADFLFNQGCELIIIACNTASAKALRKIQQEYLPKHHADKRILGVIIPIAEYAATVSRYGRIGVIGTRATIDSHVYTIELKKINSELKIYERSAPLLVPLVEEGWAGKPETNKILKKYLKPLKEKRIDTLILGCTHYPFLIKDLKRIMGKNTRIINSPLIVAEKLIDYLKRHPAIEKKINRRSEQWFYTTDDFKKFKKLGEKFLQNNIKNIKKIKL